MKQISKKILFTIIFLSTSTLSLYSTTILTTGYRQHSAIDEMPKNNVKDTKTIPQNTEAFSQQITPMSSEEQLQYDAEYNQKFFSPWQLPFMDLTEEEKSWQFKYATEKTYFRRGKRIPKSWYNTMTKNSNFRAYESLALPAISIHHTDFKIFPTSTPIYYDPKKTGEGFPFDYNQNSALYINTPLFVSHYSLDKKWVYVKSSFAFGWVKLKDIAFVDQNFISEFQNNNYAITVRDNLLLKENGRKVSLIKMGTIFPIDPLTKEYLRAKKDYRGYAHIDHVHVNQTNIIAYKPIKFNARNVEYISKQLVGEPYGWGGKLETRDCSALTRDFFAPFGIYLRRNSRQQAEDGAEFISLKGLDKTNKKRTIVNNAKACRSLLFVPGHIMLYLGTKHGKPTILHNYWGVRLKNGSKRVMGRAIITTTEPGVERSDIKKKSLLINSLTGIVNF